MKPIHFRNLFVLGIAFALVAATGCKHKPPPTTALPDRGASGGRTGDPGAGPGGTLGSTSGTGENLTSTTTGVPLGGGHQGWPENADIFKSETVYFDFDSSVVKPSEQSKVAKVADHLKGNSGDALKVEGHCDERGTEEYNRSLGERRALALREEFIRLGIDPGRVDTLSYGKDRPEDPGHNEAAWRKNRRGAFILLTPPK